MIVNVSFKTIMDYNSVLTKLFYVPNARDVWYCISESTYQTWNTSQLPASTSSNIAWNWIIISLVIVLVILPLTYFPTVRPLYKKPSCR